MTRAGRTKLDRPAQHSESTHQTQRGQPQSRSIPDEGALVLGVDDARHSFRLSPRAFRPAPIWQIWPKASLSLPPTRHGLFARYPIQLSARGSRGTKLGAAAVAGVYLRCRHQPALFDRSIWPPSIKAIVSSQTPPGPIHIHTPHAQHGIGRSLALPFTRHTSHRPSYRGWSQYQQHRRQEKMMRRCLPALSLSLACPRRCRSIPGATRTAPRWRCSGAWRGWVPSASASPHRRHHKLNPHSSAIHHPITVAPSTLPPRQRPRRHPSSAPSAAAWASSPATCARGSGPSSCCKGMQAGRRTGSWRGR